MSRRSLNQFMILTSNLGSQFLIDPELDETRKRESVLAMVRSSFKPEFLNRLDDVVIFDALKEELGFIVDLNIDKLTKRC
jgi:ATP-dependent Clp protease ATP-binding subunit ClpB